MPDLAMAFRSTSSASRLRKAGFTSAVSKPASGGLAVGIAAPLCCKRRNRRLDLLGHLGQRRSAVVGGKLDAVVLRRIVRGGKVDRAGGLQLAHGIGDGRRRRGLGNHDRRDARTGQHARRLVHKALAQKARIAAHQHAMRLRLRLHIGGNPRHRQPDIGHGKLVGHNRPPTRSAKPDPCRHRS